MFTNESCANVEIMVQIFYLLMFLKLLSTLSICYILTRQRDWGSHQISFIFAFVPQELVAAKRCIQYKTIIFIDPAIFFEV